MRKQIILGTLLLIALVIAGCTQPDLPEPGDNNNDQQQPAEGVSVQGPECTVGNSPCSATQLTQYSLPEISLSVQNTGETPAHIQLNGPRRTGEGVLSSKCDEYGVRDFTADISGRSGVEDISNQRTVSLQPGERLDATWFVELEGQVDTSNSTFLCVFRFDLAFSQDIETTRQVQVRGSEDIPRTTGLGYHTSSRTPIELVVDTDDVMTQRIVGGEPTPVQARSYIINRGPGEVTNMQDPVTRERIRLHIPGINDRDCTEQSVTVQQGEDATPGTATVCRFDPGRIDRSQIFDLAAETRYTYEMPLTPVELRLSSLVIQE